MVFVTGATSTGKLHCDWQEGALGSPCNACQVRGLTICAPLTHDDLQHMVSIVSERQLEPGGTLFSEGDPADHLFNITAGTIMVYRLLTDGRRQITGFLFPGDFLGLAMPNSRFSIVGNFSSASCRAGRLKRQTVAGVSASAL